MPIGISSIGGIKNLICQPQEHLTQINIVATLKLAHTTYIVGQLEPQLRMGPFGHPHWEDDMVHNCACSPSMFDHLGPPTTPLKKVKPFAHVK